MATKSKSKSKAKVKRSTRSAKKSPKRKSRSSFKFDFSKPHYFWMVPAFLLAAAATLLLQPKSQVQLQVTSVKLQKLFEAASDKPLQERVAYWSEKLLKDPKLLSMLGDGPKVNDSVPLFPSKYDCTTFVETVGALSRSHEGARLGDEVIRIRYKNANVNYFNRNHFPEADWIPNNESAGVLDDITEKVAKKAGLKAKFEKKTINKYAWFKKQKVRLEDRMIANISEHKKGVEVALPYIELKKFEKASSKIPQGSIINVVRESKANKPVLISHQGFLIWKNGKPYFRHASREHAITELPLGEYIASMKKMPWKVVGFNVNAFSN